MAWVRVDTQTILTIDDVVITRSQRISVRHMTDASVDYPYYLHHPHQQHPHNHHQKNKSFLLQSPPAVEVSTVQPETPHRRPSSGSIHKTWQLIIRDVQSSDAGLYVGQSDCPFFFFYYCNTINCWNPFFFVVVLFRCASWTRNPWRATRLTSAWQVSCFVF